MEDCERDAVHLKLSVDIAKQRPAGVARTNCAGIPVGRVLEAAVRERRKLTLASELSHWQRSNRVGCIRRDFAKD